MHDLVDIGANLTNRSFRGDLDSVLARARAAGVATIVVTGTDVPGSEAAVALAERHGLHATAGIPPHRAKDAGAPALVAIERLARRHEVVAVGECGLDYDRMFSPREVQRRCFEQHLALARDTRKPLFLHERGASGDFTAMMKEHRASWPPPSSTASRATPRRSMPTWRSISTSASRAGSATSAAAATCSTSSRASPPIA